MNVIARLILLAAALTAIVAEARGEKEKEVFKTKATFAFLTPDGKKLAAAGDNTRIVDIAAKKSALLSKAFSNPALGSNGKFVATLDFDGTLKVFDIAAPGKPKSSAATGKKDGVICHAFDGDATYVYGTNDSVIVLDAKTGKEKQTVKDLGGQPWSLAFTDDGTSLACGTDQGKVIAWDAAAFKVLKTFEGLPKTFAQSVAFSADGKLLAGCGDDAIKVWDVASGKAVKEFAGTKEKVVRKVAFGGDGKYLVSGSSDGLVTVWDVATGKSLDVIKMPMDVFRLSLSADAKTAAVTTEDGITKVFDLSAVYGK